jgi:hypothetical protein
VEARGSVVNDHLCSAAPEGKIKNHEPDAGVQCRQNITEFFASQLLLNTSSVTKGNVWNDLWNDISESIKEVMRYE